MSEEISKIEKIIMDIIGYIIIIFLYLMVILFPFIVSYFR